ncbi:hypothetical protein [Streptomyces sp. NPDC024089]|uniref:hypothetical protein n=1 Tax=Streptomyces sp. NPDC024089 TaxID=3154328 RepID=UPI00340D8103
MDATERFVVSLDDIVAARRDRVAPDGPAEKWARTREESLAAVRMLRRAIRKVRMSGPEEMADLARNLYDVNMRRFKMAFGAALSPPRSSTRTRRPISPGVPGGSGCSSRMVRRPPLSGLRAWWGRKLLRVECAAKA